MGAWTEIVDFTFTANETSRAFTGLNITKDDFIKIIVTQVNGSGSNSAVRCFPNTAAGVSGFNTNTNYHRQLLGGTDSGLSVSRANENELLFTGGSKQNVVFAYFKLSENGKANWFTNQYRDLDSSLGLNFRYITSSNLTFNDPITSLTFTSSVTNGLGNGSRIQIYRLDAKKVADITTTANATQVDISSLSIGKDSEYLLVSDIDNSVAASIDYNLFVNDSTTLTDYRTQSIVGDGSTASASRGSFSQMCSASTGADSMSHTHIKLSEIGAFTHQSYFARNYGGNDIQIRNSFASSTSEAITSITKLNIVSSSTNAIGSGSRFILYKLK
jgi:hypothetical protein